MPRKPKPSPIEGQAAYLDAYLGREGVKPPAPTPRAKPTPRAASPGTEGQPHRQAAPGSRMRTTLYIDADLFAEARGAVVRLAASGLEPATLSALIDLALERELGRLRAKYTGGKPFPAHPGLPGGRPRS